MQVIKRLLMLSICRMQAIIRLLLMSIKDSGRCGEPIPAEKSRHYREFANALDESDAACADFPPWK